MSANASRGQESALWLFGSVVLVRTGIGGGTLFTERMAATNADGIPLDTLGSAGAQAFVPIFAGWDQSQRMQSTIALLVLVRYRSLVRFMVTLPGLRVVGLMLSLWQRRARDPLGAAESV